jgi:cell division septal protein FtsQ
MRQRPNRRNVTGVRQFNRLSLWMRLKKLFAMKGQVRKNHRKRPKTVVSTWKRIQGGASFSFGGLGDRILRLLPHLGIVIIGLSLPVVVALGYRYLTHTPSLSIREVQVEGNQRVTPSEILEAAGVAQGPNLLALDLEAVETGLISHPWVRAAKVERALPDRLRIEISERTPSILLSLGSLYLVDVRGEIFKRLAPGEHFSLPILTGISRAHLTGELGVERMDRARRTIRDAIALVDRWQVSSLGDTVVLSEVRADPLYGFGVVMGRGAAMGTGALVHLGHEPNDAQLERLEVLLDEANTRRRRLAEIHLDDERKPNRTAVRFRSDSEREQEGLEKGRQGAVSPSGQQGTRAGIQAIALTKKERVD